MRIAITAVNNLYGWHFARQISYHFKESEILVIFQEGGQGPAAPRKSLAPRRATRSNLISRIFYKLYELWALKITPWSAIQRPAGKNILITEDINSEANRELLRTFQPDFLLVFGGKILKPQTIKIPGETWNLHGGKLPEYRGSSSLKWILLHGNHEALCSTLHIADPGVDSGAIIAEAPVKVRPWDSYRTLFARLYVAGVKTVIESLRKRMQGQGPEKRPQQGDAPPYRQRDWSPDYEVALGPAVRRAWARRQHSPLQRRLRFQIYRRLYQSFPYALAPTARQARVLLYHHVAENEDPYVKSLGVSISPDNFAEQLDYLASRFNVVRFSELEVTKKDPMAVCITVDDGYRSIIEHMLPVLERFQCPAKIFLMSSILDGELSWMNRLSYLHNKLSAQAFDDLAERALDCSLLDKKTGYKVSDFILAFVEQKTPAVILQEFQSWHPEPEPKFFLNADDIKELGKHPLIEIGSHTQNHYPLDRLSAESLKSEISGGHQRLQQVLGNTVQGFSIPFGFKTHRSAEIVEAIGAVDRHLVSAYGGTLDWHPYGGLPEVKRIGVWGNLGVLWHQMNYG